MDPIEVTTRFDRQGNVLPLRFNWRERDYKVISVGRVWQDETGWHILVMAPGDHVNELVFSVLEMRWYMGRFGLDQEAA